MSAQETEDAELVALAALLFHAAAQTQGMIAHTGDVSWDPSEPREVWQAIYERLQARGVLPKTEAKP